MCSEIASREIGPICAALSLKSNESATTLRMKDRPTDEANTCLWLLRT